LFYFHKNLANSFYNFMKNGSSYDNRYQFLGLFIAMVQWGTWKPEKTALLVLVAAACRHGSAQSRYHVHRAVLLSPNASLVLMAPARGKHRGEAGSENHTFIAN
jgi:hypothetical protein